MSQTLSRGKVRDVSKALRTEGRKLPRTGYCVRLPETVGKKFAAQGGYPAKELCRTPSPALKKLFPSSTDYFFVYSSTLSGARRRR